MAAYTLDKLSGSTDGKGIKVAATSTPGTTIHTGPSGTTDFHMPVLYAWNTDSSARLLTIEWGGTTDPDNTIEFDIPAGGYVFLMEKVPIQNSLLVRGFAAAANVIIIYGHVIKVDN